MKRAERRQQKEAQKLEQQNLKLGTILVVLDILYKISELLKRFQKPTGEVRNLPHLYFNFKLKIGVMQMKSRNFIKILLIIDIVLTLISIITELI